MSEHLERIRKVQSLLQPKQALLLFANSYKMRNRDVEYKFRQDSNYYYLTGISEANGILFIRKDTRIHFCLPKNKQEEIWTGVRLGKEKWKEILNLDESYELQEWNFKKLELLINIETLYYFFGENSERDKEILELCSHLNKKLRDGKFGPSRIELPLFLHEMRMIKSSQEISKLQEAVKITQEGHIAVIQAAKHGMYEHELEAILESTYLKHGAWGGGYGHIVASGKNATILHYTNNHDILKDGDLVLVDSGAEKDYYTADVTRVFPVAKKFTSVQQVIYEIVLDVQKKAISMVQKGVKFWDIHKETIKNLCIHLKDLKLFQESLDEIIEKELYKKYYMHKTGHWLGMDVHDVGTYYENFQSRILENGMITTIEPGLYFDSLDDSIPEEFRGIGIRIEDDILVNENSPINLTASIPKEILEIEALKS